MAGTALTGDQSCSSLFLCSPFMRRRRYLCFPSSLQTRAVEAQLGFLRRVPAFGRLAPAELLSIVPCLKMVELPKRHVIALQGADPRLTRIEWLSD